MTANATNEQLAVNSNNARATNEQPHNYNSQIMIVLSTNHVRISSSRYP